jgi:hypothetical protein
MSSVQALAPARQSNVLPLRVKKRAEAFQSSIWAERRAETISVFAALPQFDVRRLKAVGLTPPSGDVVSVVSWVIMCGDRRYWSWGARKPEHCGTISRSLQYELNLDKKNVNEAIRFLREREMITITLDTSGREILTLQYSIKLLAAESEWRWFIRGSINSIEEELDLPDSWAERSIAIDKYMLAKDLDHQRRPAVASAARALYGF